VLLVSDVGADERHDGNEAVETVAVDDGAEGVGVGVVVSNAVGGVGGVGGTVVGDGTELTSGVGVVAVHVVEGAGEERAVGGGGICRRSWGRSCRPFCWAGGSLEGGYRGGKADGE